MRRDLPEVPQAPEVSGVEVEVEVVVEVVVAPILLQISRRPPNQGH